MSRKIWLGVKSLILFICNKIKYGNRIKMHPINSVRGKLVMDVDTQGCISIGRFLMITGPCYMKCSSGGIIHIGNNCFMNHNVSITSNEYVEIGNNVNIANNVVIVDHDHIMTHDGVLGNVVSASVKIGDKVWIAANSVITKGVNIGNGAVVAAGSVVTKDIPEHELWGGTPARFIKKI